MADLHHRHADARQRQQIALRFLEHRQRQHGGTGGKVVDAMRGGKSWIHVPSVPRSTFPVPRSGRTSSGTGNVERGTTFSRLNQMHQQSVPEFRLEPGGFRRHDAARVGDGHQVVDARPETSRTPRRPCRSLTSRSSSAGPRMPPTKSMRLSVRGSPTPRSGARTRRCSTSTSSASSGAAAPAPASAARRRTTGRRDTSTPRPCGRRGRARRHRTPRAFSAARNASGVWPPRSLTTRLYGKDLHLAIRKRHGDEPVRARGPAR